jgi:uncharacterized membrane protein
MVSETTIAIAFAIVGVVFGLVKLGLLGAGVWKLDDILAAAGVETGDADEDPLETLRDRYARGELTDDEFERKLERLVETEDGVSRERVTELE